MLDLVFDRLLGFFDRHPILRLTRAVMTSTDTVPLTFGFFRERAVRRISVTKPASRLS